MPTATTFRNLPSCEAFDARYCSCVAHQVPPVRSLDSPDAHAPVSATACSQMRDSERKTMDRIERELEAAKVLILLC